MSRQNKLTGWRSCKWCTIMYTESHLIFTSLRGCSTGTWTREYMLALFFAVNQPCSLPSLINARKPSLLPSEQVAQLLPWYMQWSHDLAAKMHQRCLVQNEARRTATPSLSHDCFCDSKWRCEPHNTCFIYDSCFCPSSGSFPPVKPPRMLLSSNPF